MGKDMMPVVMRETYSESSRCWLQKERKKVSPSTIQAILSISRKEHRYIHALGALEGAKPLDCSFLVAHRLH